MKLLWTTIYVKNLEESIAFYADLAGLKLQRRFPAGPGIEIAFMGNGTENETLVELLADSSKTAINHSEFISIGFSVDSVDTMLKTLESKGIGLLGDPVETPAMKYITIKDPNGLTVQFFQQK